MRKIYLFFPFFIFSFGLFSQEKNPDMERNGIPIYEALKETGIQFLEKQTCPPKQEKKKKELTVDLRNPTYKQGILLTHEGGVIQNEDIRIQAKVIQYIRRVEEGKQVHRIEAEGDLMLQFQGRTYVGEELEYDFITQRGTVYLGKTFNAPWYFSGDKIELKPNGTYKIKNAAITTCESADSAWDIHANEVDVKNKNLVNAKNVKFRLFRVPAFYLPSFKVNLKKFFSTPLIRYSVDWDKSSGPRGSLRYQVYSWKDFALFLRGDYRFTRGFGGAIETEYLPEHKRTEFITKSFLATDVVPRSLKKKRRYRLQGKFHSISPDKRDWIDLCWDKFSDIDMPGDFKSDDFEINTAKKTELFAHHQRSSYIANLFAKPRANSFETVKQDLPSLYLTHRPVAITPLKVISQNWMKASYLDLAYSKHIERALSDFNSMRVEIRNILYRPLFTPHFVLVPKMELQGIFYSDTPESEASGLASLYYSMLGYTDFSHRYRACTHIIRPYLEFSGQTEPNLNVNEHYIFSLGDGVSEINKLRVGMKHYFIPFSQKYRPAAYSFDLYADGFFSKHAEKRVIPKLYLDMEWNLSSLFLSSYNAWNFNKKTIDYSNLRLGYTLNEDAAFALEFRHRSAYDWRKVDHENFILDVTRKEDNLLASPLSDRRNTFLTNIYLRLTPLWSMHFQSHHGWGRKNEGPYNECKIDFYTLVASRWRVKLSYMHTQKDDKVSASVTLVKK